MSLLSRGQRWLNNSLQGAAGVSLTYTRGAQSVTLTGWVGRTAFAQAGGQGGAAVIWGDRDYLFPAADLILGGSVVTPQRGDRITEIIAGTTLTFEVIAPGNEPAWRYSDAGRQTLRVHTKKVG